MPFFSGSFLTAGKCRPENGGRNEKPEQLRLEELIWERTEEEEGYTKSSMIM